jgi:hypothetical protein
MVVPAERYAVPWLVLTAGIMNGDDMSCLDDVYLDFTDCASVPVHWKDPGSEATASFESSLLGDATSIPDRIKMLRIGVRNLSLQFGSAGLEKGLAPLTLNVQRFCLKEGAD